MATIFCPDTALEHAVHAGDYAGTLALLRAMPRAERRQHADSARRMRRIVDEARWSAKDDTYSGWGVPALDVHLDATFAVVLVCGTARDVAQCHGPKPDLVSLCQEFQPDALDGLAEALLAATPHYIVTIQSLITASLIPRPQGEDYTIGLISLPTSRAFDTVWQDDPGLRDTLLQVMDIEGTGEFSLAAVDKYLPDALCWSTLLLRLSDEGVYPRELLMDRTLAALERDWPQFRAGWFSRFHATLKPDVALLRANSERYLRLCHSRIPPTVSLALDVIKQLEPTGAIDDDALLEALQPVLHATAKGQVVAALKLLDGRIKRTPSMATEAAAITMVALAHDSADVQAQVLQRLTRWGCDPMQLAPYADGIAAVHASALQALIGAAAVRSPSPPPSANVHDVEAPPRGKGPTSPLDETRRLQQPGDPDALVACIAHVFENDCDTDAFEVAASALVQAAPFDATLRERLGPVIKRATKVRTPVAHELARLLLALFRGAPALPEFNDTQLIHLPGAHRCLLQRTEAWATLGLHGKRLAPLSAATHRNGWIAPDVLVDRANRHAQMAVEVDLQEQVRALLRLPPEPSPAGLAAARRLQDTPFARALRYALGDAIAPELEHAALFAAAARIRHPGQDDPALAALLGDIGPDGAHAARLTWRVHGWSSSGSDKAYHHHGIDLEITPARREVDQDWLAIHRHQLPPNAPYAYSFLQTPWFGGGEECMIRFAAALLPNSLDAHFADGARTIGNNLDWWGAQWGDKAYLERLLDPTLHMSALPTLLLALGLGAKEPGQQAISVDALIASYMEGRLDVAALAADLRTLSATPLLKAARYARSLQAALRLEPAMHQAVFVVLCEMVQASPDAPQKDVASLLELMLELALAHGHALPGDVREALRGMRATGKAKPLVKGLLEA